MSPRRKLSDPFAGETRYLLCADRSRGAKVVSDHGTLMAATMAKTCVALTYPKACVRVGRPDPLNPAQWVLL